MSWTSPRQSEYDNSSYGGGGCFYRRPNYYYFPVFPPYHGEDDYDPSFPGDAERPFVDNIFPMIAFC